MHVQVQYQRVSFPEIFEGGLADEDEKDHEEEPTDGVGDLKKTR